MLLVWDDETTIHARRTDGCPLVMDLETEAKLQEANIIMELLREFAHYPAARIYVVHPL